MRQSMTGFAAGQGARDGLRWTWDLRSVNGKGLDLRIRVPDWIDGLEAGLRSAITPRLSRGNVTISLRLQGSEDEGALRLCEPQLEHVLDAMTRIEADAMAAGLSLAPSTAAQIVGLRGILEQSRTETDTAALRAQLLAEFPIILDGFIAMRAAEGTAVQAVLMQQLDEIAALTEQAVNLIPGRQAEQADKLRAALARVLDNSDGADPQRVAQELALIAVKADVTEEIDRLRAHVAAGRDLLATDGPMGRKLDFLSQEFNREANTLCSKAQSVSLTAVGLQLKTVIDQMREQVQNVE
ncbi:YicC/YloC family endoribonuclease [Puniceibacterium sp. IMCC21224]|uniref:YicC/YloC family endoribonuclease n=1 Tax=Puniceibacterium sp. IMCC21224 TaxID=1618204 RepID=UPI00065D876D|nr:YicC/YloC family endoribonuclease [Puniceibacterium sp. IMCC21224]KMK67469.1 TIGR00255 family protein [Puniceibacterium sp. IMCC21224]